MKMCVAKAVTHVWEHSKGSVDEKKGSVGELKGSVGTLKGTLNELKGSGSAEPRAEPSWLSRGG